MSPYSFLLFLLPILMTSCHEQAQPSLNSALPVPVLTTSAALDDLRLVPMSALVEGTGMKASIFIIAPGIPKDGVCQVQRLEVEFENLSQHGATLRTPLPEGTRIVTTGAEFLVDAAKVTVNSIP